MPVKSCNIHRKYKAGCDNCKEKSKLYQKERYTSFPRNRMKTKNTAVKHCSRHGKYKAGCPDCQEKSRVYNQERRKGKTIGRKPNKTAHVSQEMWDRMTEIGLRWEKEGLI